MVRTIEDIENKISISDRENTTYIHPIASQEEIAKLISAYSNSDGGDIIFGIRDDGISLNIKNFAFTLNLDGILALLEGIVKIKYNYFNYKGNKLFYISVDKSKDLIKANHVPYHIIKDGNIEEILFKKIFISYAHKDSDLVNILEHKLTRKSKIKITRDIDVLEYRDSLEEFMKTIRNHDFVISVVSSTYIKSINCMYEIMQLMQDTDYQEKLIFIILNKDDINYYTEKNRYTDFEAKIYDSTDRLNYVAYWSTKQIELRQKIAEAGLPPELMANVALDMRKLNSIVPSMDDFINLLSDKVGRSFKEMCEDDFSEIIKVIKK